MFFGEYRHNLDAKGRLTVPAKFRNQCQDTVMVTIGFDGCIALYNHQGWQDYYNELIATNKNARDTRKLLRIIMARTSELEFDKLGRINIPKGLKDKAGLDKEVVINGAGDHVEIWGERAWDEFALGAEEELDDIFEKMFMDKE